MIRPCLLLAVLALAPGCETVRGVLGPTTGAPAATAPSPATDRQQARNLYLDVIRGLRERGSNRAALAHLDEYERQHGQSPASNLMRGEILTDLGDEPGATAALGRISGGAEQAAALNTMGLLAGRGARWNEAKDRFEAAIRLEPTNVRFINNLGFALLNLGDAPGAEHRLRMASELDPNSEEVRNNIALLLLATGRRADGERVLGQIQSSETRNAIRREAQRLTIRPERRS
ncbi:tetratricopeptide repeat protein [Rhodovarius crocodyli]|uniref:Tetratricopeptide repeat protein n=1 Tax=Rhodovarius crocodyli TaxID=1979269 RepID=A0A437M1I9_9PROT|nr:tetratricopeptide repeat protein [Rhodovarius crocodyli]RVT91547.1 tetratricopeptide repeat protein [Rhodovarius crocodyli]